MNLQQLRYLVATADHGTMTAGAHAAHVAQPVLTRALHALERELGLTLFTRTGRRVELTPDGLRVVELARRTLAYVATIEALGRDHHRTDASAVLTLAITPSLATELGVTLLPRFRRHAPDVRVRLLQCTSRSEVVASVRSAVAAVGGCDLPMEDDLDYLVLAEREAIVLVPSGSLLPEPLPPARLEGLDWILPTPANARRAELESLFVEVGVRPRVAMESDDRASWLAWVRAGLGSCLWSRPTDHPVPVPPGTEPRRIDPSLRYPVGLVYRGDAIGETASQLIDLARGRGGRGDHAA